MQVMKTVLVLVLLAYPHALAAQTSLPSASISIRNASNSSVLIDLNWMITGYCQALAPFGDPSVSVAGQTLSITTINSFFDCPPPPPPPPPPSPPVPFTPVPAHITAIAGLLPDGHYSVVWSFTNYSGNPSYPPPIAPVKGEFFVIGGVAVLTPSAVPIAAPFVLALLAFTLAIIGLHTSSHS